MSCWGGEWIGLRQDTCDHCLWVTLALASPFLDEMLSASHPALGVVLKVRCPWKTYTLDL